MQKVEYNLNTSRVIAKSDGYFILLENKQLLKCYKIDVSNEDPQ